MSAPLRESGKKLVCFVVWAYACVSQGDDMALGEEVWFLQSGLDGFVEREGGGIQGRSKASEMSSAAGDVQVVRQRDAMAGSDLQHFMLAIAVERRPLDARRSVGGVC
jgi:hypothetical protein